MKFPGQHVTAQSQPTPILSSSPETSTSTVRNRLSFRIPSANRANPPVTGVSTPCDSCIHHHHPPLSDTISRLRGYQKSSLTSPSTKKCWAWCPAWARWTPSGPSFKTFTDPTILVVDIPYITDGMWWGGHIKNILYWPHSSNKLRLGPLGHDFVVETSQDLSQAFRTISNSSIIRTYDIKRGLDFWTVTSACVLPKMLQFGPWTLTVTLQVRFLSIIHEFFSSICQILSVSENQRDFHQTMRELGSMKKFSSSKHLGKIYSLNLRNRSICQKHIFSCIKTLPDCASWIWHGSQTNNPYDHKPCRARLNSSWISSLQEVARTATQAASEVQSQVFS